MAKLVIYSDFDGTMTARNGYNTVFSKFYWSLLTSDRGNYKSLPLKDTDTVQCLFKSYFGNYDENFDYKKTDADILIEAAAVKFFHEILKHEDVSVNIVTKNRQDYIQHVLRYQNFTEEEINKITIMDSGDKWNCVKEDLKQQVEGSQLYILDDTDEDLHLMVSAADSSNFKAIVKIKETPGNFKWEQYLNKINNDLTNDKDNTIEYEGVTFSP